MTAFLLICYVIVGLCLFDAARRPAHQWADADRQKGYWVSMLVVSFLILPAFVFVPGYVFGVLPRFTADADTSTPDPFRKK